MSNAAARNMWMSSIALALRKAVAAEYRVAVVSAGQAGAPRARLAARRWADELAQTVGPAEASVSGRSVPFSDCTTVVVPGRVRRESSYKPLAKRAI